VIKAIEYKAKFEHGSLPGQWYHNPHITAPGANLYFTIYFLSTGLHAFHVIVGASVLAWVLKGVVKGKYGPRNYVAVELGASTGTSSTSCGSSCSPAVPDIGGDDRG